MRNRCFILFLLLGSLSTALAQVIGFEEEVPEMFKLTGKGELNTSSLYYKEGESSLKWDFQPGSVLEVQSPLSLNEKKEKQFGIALWIYNEKPQQDSLRFEFVDKTGKVSYCFSYYLKSAGNEKKEKQFGIALWIYNEKPQQDSLRFEFVDKTGKVSYCFSYYLKSAGWRACWISFDYMKGDKKNKNLAGWRVVAPQRKGRVFIDRLTFPVKKVNWRACWISFDYMKGDKKNKNLAGWRVVAPQRKGRVFIDRLTFPVKKVNDRTTPDMQMPANNGLSNRDLGICGTGAWCGNGNSRRMPIRCCRSWMLSRRKT